VHDLAEQFDAGQTRHHHVRDDKRIIRFGKTRERFFDGSGGDARITRGKTTREKRADGFFVVNNKNAVDVFRPAIIASEKPCVVVGASGAPVVNTSV
jgi:hypothetical protein